MKTEKNILIAFLLNLAFSLFELFGGFFTNSVAIISDAIHDFGDAMSIGVSYFLEKKSKKKPDNKYTYGYTRYSILGAFITNTILITSSVLVIVNAIERSINPIEINYNGMLIFAVFGTIINFLAAYFTKDGDSLNQKSVNLHMLEDVLGWIVVLIGAILIKFTRINIIDSILSIGVAIFISVHALKSFKKILDLFLEKTPNDINLEELKEHILQIEDIIDVHHIHIWSMDGINNYATMHLVTKIDNVEKLKQDVRNELKEHKINHVTIELEDETHNCEEKECEIRIDNKNSYHHHH